MINWVNLIMVLIFLELVQVWTKFKIFGVWDKFSQCVILNHFWWFETQRNTSLLCKFIFCVWNILCLHIVIWVMFWAWILVCCRQVTFWFRCDMSFRAVRVNCLMCVWTTMVVVVEMVVHDKQAREKMC